jgi:hypothetical protein
MNNYEIDNDDYLRLIDDAALFGHFDILKWLCEDVFDKILFCKKYECKAIDNWVGNGNLVALEWIYKNYNPYFSEDAIENAAAGGHLDVIKWLYNHCGKWTKKAIDYAAGGGHLDVIEWLYLNSDIRCSKKAIEFAAVKGYLDVIKYLHKNGQTKCHITALTYAGHHRHVEVENWIRQNMVIVYNKRYNFLQFGRCMEKQKEYSIKRGLKHIYNHDSMISNAQRMGLYEFDY